MSSDKPRKLDNIAKLFQAMRRRAIRTIARKSSIGGLYVCAGRLDVLKMMKLY